MTLFAAEGLVMQYGARRVLDLPRLTVPAERTVALLGPNGAGKTTLLHILGFLLPPTRGRIRYRREAVRYADRTLRALRRRIILVEQHPIMFSTTVARNVEFGLKIRGVDAGERRRRVDQSLERVGLRSLARAHGRQLSGGETQRVAIARALACEPEVLLLDEPTANVDIENRLAIEEIITTLRETRGLSVVFCTHDHLQAARLAQEKINLFNGCLDPRHYENIFSGRCIATPRGARCVVNGKLRLPAPATDQDTIRIAVDPRQLRLLPATAADTTNGIEGRVIQLCEEGRWIRVVVAVGLPLAVLMPVADYHRRPLQIGDAVCLVCPPEAVSLI
ncbi:MAG: ATP-binding cassette domain-containing protein [Desulfobacterales bacterium]|nr:ATP-binding cassette domain-containing protein [Desulfobacterales bacterium]MDJ0888591.1 ATP-binding cassette domain-containing protein [Desulfobacterales bacterium]MDJ0991645.1 ATP-binding cassette domain-containing protein [Desulfobacterales bacterium]